MSLRVVREVGNYQIASCNWVLITTSARLPPQGAAPPSTAGDASVDKAVLPSPGPVSPQALLPLARAFPSGSVTSGPTGPGASLGRSRAALIASVSRLSAAFSLRSCRTPQSEQVQYGSRPNAALSVSTACWMGRTGLLPLRRCRTSLPYSGSSAAIRRWPRRGWPLPDGGAGPCTPRSGSRWPARHTS